MNHLEFKIMPKAKPQCKANTSSLLFVYKGKERYLNARTLPNCKYTPQLDFWEIAFD